MMEKLVLLRDVLLALHLLGAAGSSTATAGRRACSCTC
jgi:hypothetical protein